MNVAHARLPAQVFINRRDIDACRYSAQYQLHRFTEQPPSTDNDHDDDYQAYHWIEPVPACENYRNTRSYHARGNGSIRRHVQIGRPDVQVALTSLQE